MKVFWLLFLVVAGMTAQEIPVDDFTKVTAFDQIDVQLIPSDENKVLLNGAGSDEVQLVNKNGELKIRMPLTKLLSGDDISATVFYKTLTAVEANEGSRISGESVISSDHFEVITKEGSVIELTLDVKNLSVRMNDGSKVSLMGKTSSQDVLLNSGSIYQAKALQSVTANITANAGAVGSVNASIQVDAKCRAGGEITIYGKPKHINKKTIAGGNIYEKGD